MGEIKLGGLPFSILLRGALGCGREGLWFLKQHAIQYKANICCYFSKPESDVRGFLAEELGIKEKSFQTQNLPVPLALP